MAKDGAWRTGSMNFCMKFDCMNREQRNKYGFKICDDCFRFSYYIQDKKPVDKTEKS